MNCVFCKKEYTTNIQGLYTEFCTFNAKEELPQIKMCDDCILKIKKRCKDFKNSIPRFAPAEYKGLSVEQRKYRIEQDRLNDREKYINCLNNKSNKNDCNFAKVCKQKCYGECFTIFEMKKPFTNKQVKEFKKNMTKQDRNFIRRAELSINGGTINYVSKCFDIYPKYTWNEDLIIKHYKTFEFLRNLDCSLFENGNLY